MTKPLSLFINPDDGWSLEYGFGWNETSDETSITFEVNDHISLHTAKDGLIYAASSGEISVKLPGTEGLDPIEEPLNESIALDDSVEDTVDITLHLSLNNIRASDFRAKSRGIHSITGFKYFNVEVAYLVEMAALHYKNVTLPKEQLSRKQVLAQLFRGELKIPVKTGGIIGRASIRGAPQEYRHLKFAVLTTAGPIDPAYTYEWMRDFVADGQPKVDALLNLIPVRWPLFDPLQDKAVAIANTEDAIFPFSALEGLRRQFNLNDEEWRTIGNNQKTLYMHRLRKRYGHAIPGRTDPPFEFNDLDRKNIFQLEAVVEFFANFDDPWKLGATPQEKVPPFTGVSAAVAGNEVILDGDHDLNLVKVNHHFIYLSEDTNRPTRKYRIVAVEPNLRRVMIDEAPNVAGNTAWKIEIYKTINFLPMSGTEAIVTGKKVTLDGIHGLTRIKPNNRNLLYDTIYLKGVTGEETLHRIMSIDPDKHALTIEPELPVSNGIFSWHINHRPILVIIDPFGPRYQLRGISASVSPNDPSLIILTPKSSEDALNRELDRVNLFDTAYFPADVSSERRIYRITEVSSKDLTIRVDGQPNFNGGTSACDIQAGIGGNLDALVYSSDENASDWQYNMGPNHWDGALFVTCNGEVRSWHRWNSFTSRLANGRQELSSIRGNREYDFYSTYSSNSFRNYSIKVADALANYDGVREARLYFGDFIDVIDQNGNRTEEFQPQFVTPDSVQPGQVPVNNGNGKTSIRLHHSRRNRVNSLGCLVSPFYRSLCTSLIEIYQEEYEKFYGTGQQDSEIADLQGINHTRAEALYNSGGLARRDWNNKLAGTLWVIRPDERPLNEP